MVEVGEDEMLNGAVENGSSERDNSENHIFIETSNMEKQEESFYTVIHRLFSQIFFPDPHSQASLVRRINRSLNENSPALKEASINSTRNLLVWMRRGGPWRSLLVISVGTITLLALTGLLVFMLFFLAATANAVVISFLMSLAAAGGFLAIFFACLVAIYIGALSVAVVIISITTIMTIFAVMIATGWIGFFLTVWLAVKKSLDLTKRSLSMTGTALSAYSSARHGHHRHRENQIKS